MPQRIQDLLARIVLASYLMGFGAAIVLGAGYYKLAGNSAQAQSSGQTLITVGRQTIVSSIKAAGKVTFASEQTLKFNQKGTVTKVNVKEGDSVKAGQVIAELDSTSVLADIRQAQLAISASALQLKQMKGDNQKQVLDAQNALRDTQRQAEQAQNDLTVSQQKLPSDLASAQRAVTEKQAALDQAKSDLAKQKTTEIQGLGTTTQSILATSDGILDSFYNVLTRGGSRPTTTQNNEEIVINNLLYRDTVLAQQVQFAYLNAANAADAMHMNYGTSLATQTDPATLLNALHDADTLAKAIYDLGEKTYDMLQGATTDTNTFKASDLNTLRSTVSTNRSKASDLITQVQTAQANLAAASENAGIPSVTLQQKQDAVTSAENALKTAQANLQVLTTQTPGDLQQQQQAVSKIQDDLKSKQSAVNNTSTSTDVQLQLKQNDIAQKVAALQKIQKTLDDYKLVAPFDGILRHLDYKVGDNLLDTGDTESASLENPDFIVVTIPLDQVDVVRVKSGMSAAITFDAVAGKTFLGTIDKIDSTPIEQSGVVSYNVSIKLPAPKDLTILSGMTATVSIETVHKDNVLAVPNLALRQSGGNETVQEANGQTITVQTGVTDGQYTEITSGLQGGESIVSMNIPVQTQAGTNANAAQQLLRGAGGFGGGGNFRGGAGGAAVRVGGG